MAGRTPRFVIRTMATTFATVVFILAAVLLVVTLIVRDRMQTSVIEHLTTQQGVLQTLEQRRVAEMQAQMLAESPTVKAAMDAYHSESRLADGDGRTQLLETVSRELWRHAGSQFDADVVQALAAAAPTLRLDHARPERAVVPAARSVLVNFPRA